MAELGAFGPVVFETSVVMVRTFESLREDRCARYATHDVLNLEQKLQFLGLKLVRVELLMRFHQRFCSPQDELDTLRRALAEHLAYPLVIGGKNLGDFVLEEVGTTWRHLTDKGYLLHASAQVSLREYH